MGLVARGIGLVRSWLIYRAIPWRGTQLRHLYRRFVPQAGLAFDVGAHAGNRVAAFRQLGARVVALEPQADFVWLLKRRFGRDADVTVLPIALGRSAGQMRMHISELTPTVSTLSTQFVQEAMAAPSFRGVRWEQGPVVQVTTLDALIATHGVPDFVKIDVEGFEEEVLRGLSQPLPALSFEFVPAVRGVALGCIDRLEALAGPGRYRYAVSLGESQRLLTPDGERAAAMRDWLNALPVGAPSGDVHAWLPG